MKKFLIIMGMALGAVVAAIVLAVIITAIKGDFGDKNIKIETLSWETAQDGIFVDDFNANLKYTPDNATNKSVTIKIVEGNQVVSVPSKVTAGEPFKVTLKKDDNGNNIGGKVTLQAFSDLAVSEKLNFYVDVEIPVNGLEIVTDNKTGETSAGGVPFNIYVQTNPQNAINPFTGEVIDLLKNYKNVNLISEQPNNLKITKVGEGEGYYCPNHKNPNLNCKPYYTYNELVENAFNEKSNCPSCGAELHLRKYVGFLATPVQSNVNAITLTAKSIRTYLMQEDFKPFENILEDVSNPSGNINVQELLENYSNFLNKYKKYIEADSRPVYNNGSMIYANGADFVKKLSVNGKIVIDGEVKLKDSLNYVFIDSSSSFVITEVKISALVSDYVGDYEFTLNPSNASTQKTVSQVVNEFGLRLQTSDGQTLSQETINQLFSYLDIKVYKQTLTGEYVEDDSVISVTKQVLNGNTIFNFAINKPLTSGEPYFINFSLNVENKTFETKYVPIKIKYNAINNVTFAVMDDLRQDSYSKYIPMNLNVESGLNGETRLKSLDSNKYVIISAENNEPSYSAVKFFITKESAGSDGYFKVKVKTNPVTLQSLQDSSTIEAYELPQDAFRYDSASKLYRTTLNLEALNVCDGKPAIMFAAVMQTNSNGEIIEENGNMVFVAQSTEQVEIRINNYVDKMNYYTVHESDNGTVFTKRNVESNREGIKLISRNDYDIFATNLELDNSGDVILPSNSTDSADGWAGKINYIENSKFAMDKTLNPLNSNLSGNSKIAKFIISGNAENKEYVSIKPDSISEATQTETYLYLENASIFPINGGALTYPVCKIDIRAEYENTGNNILLFDYEQSAIGNKVPQGIADTVKREAQSLINVRNANFAFNEENGEIIIPQISAGEINLPTFALDATNVETINLVASVTGNSMQWKFANDNGSTSNVEFAFNTKNLLTQFTLLSSNKVNGAYPSMLDEAFAFMKDSIIESILNDTTTGIKFIKWNVSNLEFAEIDASGNLILKKGTAAGENVTISYSVFLYQQQNSTESNPLYDLRLDGKFVLNLKQQNVENSFSNPEKDGSKTENSENTPAELAGGSSVVLWQEGSGDNLISLALAGSDIMRASGIKLETDGSLYFLNVNGDKIYEINNVNEYLTSLNTNSIAVHTKAAVSDVRTFISVIDPFGKTFNYYVKVAKSIEVIKPDQEKIEITYGEEINLNNLFTVKDLIDTNLTYKLYFEVVTGKETVNINYYKLESGNRVVTTNAEEADEIILTAANTGTTREAGLKMFYFSNGIKYEVEGTVIVSVKNYLTVTLKNYNGSVVSNSNPVKIKAGESLDLFNYLNIKVSESQGNLVESEWEKFIQLAFDLSNLNENQIENLKNVLGVTNIPETIPAGVINTVFKDADMGAFKIKVMLKNVFSNSTDYKTTETLNLSYYIYFAGNAELNVSGEEAGTATSPITLITNKVNGGVINIGSTETLLYNSESSNNLIEIVSENREYDYIHENVLEKNIKLYKITLTSKDEVKDNTHVLRLNTTLRNDKIATISVEVKASVNETETYRLEILVQSKIFEIYLNVVAEVKGVNNYSFNNAPNNQNFEYAYNGTSLNFESNFLALNPRMLYEFNNNTYYFESSNSTLVNIANQSDVIVVQNVSNENNKIVGVYELVNGIVNKENNLLNTNLCALSNNLRTITFSNITKEQNVVVEYKNVLGAVCEYEVHLNAANNYNYVYELKNENNEINSISNPQIFYAGSIYPLVNRNGSSNYINLKYGNTIQNSKLVVKYVESYEQGNVNNKVSGIIQRNGESEPLKPYDSITDKVVFRSLGAKNVIVKFAVCANNTADLNSVSYYYALVQPDVNFKLKTQEVYAPGGTYLINDADRTKDIVQITKKSNTESYYLTKDISFRTDSEFVSEIASVNVNGFNNIVLRLKPVSENVNIQLTAVVGLDVGIEEIAYTFTLKVKPNISVTQKQSSIVAPKTGETKNVEINSNNKNALVECSFWQIDEPSTYPISYTYKVNDIVVDNVITISPVNTPKAYTLTLIVTFGSGADSVNFETTREFTITPNTDGVSEFISYGTSNSANYNFMQVFSGTEVLIDTQLEKNRLISQENNKGVISWIQLNYEKQQPKLVFAEKDFINNEYLSLVYSSDNNTVAGFKFNLPYGSAEVVNVEVPVYLNFTDSGVDFSVIKSDNELKNYFASDILKFNFRISDNANLISFKADSVLGTSSLNNPVNIYDFNKNKNENDTVNTSLILSEHINVSSYVNEFTNASGVNNLTSNLKVNVEQTDAVENGEIEFRNVVVNGAQVLEIVFNGTPENEDRIFKISVNTADYNSSADKTDKIKVFYVLVPQTSFVVKSENNINYKVLNIEKTDNTYSVVLPEGETEESYGVSVENNLLKINLQKAVEYYYTEIYDGEQRKVALNINNIQTTSRIANIQTLNNNELQLVVNLNEIVVSNEGSGIIGFEDVNIKIGAMPRFIRINIIGKTIKN